LTACSSPPAPPPPAPNPALFKLCDRPGFDTDNPTWRDLARLAAARGEAIDYCNARLEKLQDPRNW
jgi:hypothetical protein